jgi:hypothetical protein
MSPLFVYIDLDGTIHTDTFFDTINPSHWFSRKLLRCLTLRSGILGTCEHQGLSGSNRLESGGACPTLFAGPRLGPSNVFFKLFCLLFQVAGDNLLGGLIVVEPFISGTSNRN